MKSPQFEARSAPIRKLFTPSRLEWTWKKKVRYDMGDQVFRDLVEHLDFHVNLKAECKKLSDEVCAGVYSPAPPMRLLLEKSKGLCRQMVVPTARDAVVLQCLSDSLYPDISKQAPSSNAFYQPKDHSFSKKKLKKDEEGKIDGYGTMQAWLGFQEEAFKFSKTFEYVIVTDVANYYDTINYSQLRNTIAGLAGVRESVLDLLIFTLSGLLWQPDYMPRTNTGLPQMDLDAPRLLAHCFLFELDEHLVANEADFARFMDDINIGVESIPKAKRTLRDVDLILQTRQIRLNSGKTKILDKAEAEKHFRVVENGVYDILEEELSDNVKAGESLEDDGELLVMEISQGLDSDEYSAGNGDKILKRMIGICNRHQFAIPGSDVIRIFRRWPSCREIVLRHLSVFPLNNARAATYRDLSADAYIVDDACRIQIGNALTSTCAKSKQYEEEIGDVIDEFLYRGIYGFSSAVTLASKYKDQAYLLWALKKQRSVWSQNASAGRQVGALAPIFLNSPAWDEFVATVLNSRNDGAVDTFRFQEALRSDKQAMNRIMDIVKKPNPSRGTRINHSKFMCLLSVLQNEQLPNGLRQFLVGAHEGAWLDVYYLNIAQASAGLLSLVDGSSSVEISI